MTEEKKRLSPAEYRAHVREGDLRRELTIRLTADVERRSVVHNLINAPLTHDELYRLAQAIVERTPDVTGNKQAQANALAQSIAMAHGYDVEHFRRYNLHMKVARMPTPFTWKQVYLDAERYCTPEQMPVLEKTLRDYLLKGPKQLPLTKFDPNVMTQASAFDELATEAMRFRGVLETSMTMLERDLVTQDRMASTLRHAEPEMQDAFMAERTAKMQRLHDLKQIVKEVHKLAGHYGLANKPSHMDIYQEGHRHMRESARHVPLEQRAATLARVMRSATDVLAPKTLLNGELVAQIERVANSMVLMSQCVETKPIKKANPKTVPPMQGPLMGAKIETAKDITESVLQRAQQKQAIFDRRQSRARNDDRIRTTISNPTNDVEVLRANIAHYQQEFGQGKGRT